MNKVETLIAERKSTVEQELQAMIKKCNILKRERDEARRYACENNQLGLSHRQLAKIKGWNCFDLENGNA